MTLNSVSANLPSSVGSPLVVAGMAAIAILLRYVRSHRYTVFVAYRLLVAALVIVALLAR